MRFSTHFLALMAVASAAPLAANLDERDVIITQKKTVTTTFCSETSTKAPVVTKAAVPKAESPAVVVTVIATATVKSTDVVTKECSKCEQEWKSQHEKETPAPPAPKPAPPAPKPAPPAPKPAPPAPAPSAPPAPLEPVTVWNIVTQYTTICPKTYVPPPCNEAASSLSSLVSALSGKPAASSSEEISYVDVTVTPTSTVNLTVTPTVTVVNSKAGAATSQAGAATSQAVAPSSKAQPPVVPAPVSTQNKVVGSAAPTPVPKSSVAKELGYSASVAAAASSAVADALKELAFHN